MAHNSDDIVISKKAIKKSLKYLLFFTLEITVALSIIVFAVDFLNRMPRPLTPLSTADSMAVANSFMVYVTFLFVIVTVGITLAGIYFSRWWSREKKQVLSDNWSDMVEEIKKNDKLMTELKEGLLSESLEDMMKNELERHKKDVDDETSKKLRKLYQYISDTIEVPASQHELNKEKLQEMSEFLKGELDAKV